MTGAVVAEHEAPLTVGPLFDRRRWIALIAISLAQLMVVLDATIVNIALPHAQAQLAIPDTERSWVITAYTLAFGGLLLLGGRIADYWGRKRTFLLGLTGFAVASAVGGFAPNGETLFAARAFQGAFGALLAPAALALLSVAFLESRERARAFGVYGAIIGGGAAVGLLVGGVLTQYLDWRWCMWVNVAIAVVAGLIGLWALRESRASDATDPTGRWRRYDIGGAVLITGGLAGLVYGFTVAADPAYGWDHVYTWLFIGASLLLIAGFVTVEAFIGRPLLPLRVVLARTRGGAYLVSMLTGAGLVGVALFMVLYFQEVLAYSPLVAGLAALPVTAGIFLAYPVATLLLTRLGATPIMAAGAFIGAGGLLLLTRIDITGDFWGTVLPGELVLGLGIGLIFVPLGAVALQGVHPRDAGVASAVVNASQQVGASLGVAALSAVALQAATAYVTRHLTSPAALLSAEFVNQVKVHSYQVTLFWAAGFFAVAGLVVLALIRAGRVKPGELTVPLG
jgi:EmrB/QacA subfamily drug resistance transporter